jgi:hypothetical protein
MTNISRGGAEETSDNWARVLICTRVLTIAILRKTAIASIFVSMDLDRVVTDTKIKVQRMGDRSSTDTETGETAKEHVSVGRKTSTSVEQTR